MKKQIISYCGFCQRKTLHTPKFSIITCSLSFLMGTSIGVPLIILLELPWWTYLLIYISLGILFLFVLSIILVCGAFRNYKCQVCGVGEIYYIKPHKTNVEKR